MNTQTASARRQNHRDRDAHSDNSVETCPLCGSTLTGASYRQAMARLEQVEKDAWRLWRPS